MTSTETGSKSQETVSCRDSIEDKIQEDTPLKKDLQSTHSKLGLGAKNLKCPICQQHVKDALNIHLSTGHYQ